MRLISDVLN